MTAGTKLSSIFPRTVDEKILQIMVDNNTLTLNAAKYGWMVLLEWREESGKKRERGKVLDKSKVILMRFRKSVRIL